MGARRVEVDVVQAEADLVQFLDDLAFLLPWLLLASFAVVAAFTT